MIRSLWTLHTRRRLCATMLLLIAPSAPALAAQGPASNTISYRGEQPVRARHGMVVSVHHLAADAGVEILKRRRERGGCGGGDGIRAGGGASRGGQPGRRRIHADPRRTTGKTIFIDYREKAPLAATAGHVSGCAGQRDCRTRACWATARLPVRGRWQDWRMRSANMGSWG